MEVHATVYIDRRASGELEEVGQFTFIDMAEIAAQGITDRYKYSTEVHYEQDKAKRRFEWGKVEKHGVREV